MTPEARTSILIIGLFIAFSAGVYVGRDQAPQSQIPSNFDIGASLAESKLAREEAKNCYALLAGGIAEVKAVCSKSREDLSH